MVELWVLVFLDVKRRTTDQRRSQGVKRKYQKQKETRHLVVVDSDSNSEDNPKIRNEKVSRGKTQFEKKLKPNFMAWSHCCVLCTEAAWAAGHRVAFVIQWSQL